MNIETERKFLIAAPDSEFIKSLDQCRVLEIQQTYLKQLPDSPKTERRVRKICENGSVSYVLTIKKPHGSISRYEYEQEISPDEYAALLDEAYSEIVKTRFAFPYGGHIMEIDVYPPKFGGALLDGYAILEVELNSSDEAEQIIFPDYLRVLREVTGERQYHNKTLAHLIKG